MSVDAPQGGGRDANRSAIAPDFAASDSGGETTPLSLARWLEETATVQSVVVEANVRIRRQMEEIQASIIHAQDHLADDDEVGQMALKKKVDCAEKYHQAACQFGRLVDDVMCFAALMPQLVRNIDLLRPQDFAQAINAQPGPFPYDSAGERTWVAGQLARIKDELARIDASPANISIRQLSVCVASLNAVVKLLTRRIDDIGDRLRNLVAEIDELDRLIAHH